MKKRDWAIALALALCAATLAACGSSAGGSGGGEKQKADEEAGLAFAECMRAHGAEMEDPKPGQKAIELNDPNDPTTKKAGAACNGKLGDAGQELSADEGEEFKEGWLAFAQCMRDEGIEMGDPRFLGPGKMLLDIAGLDTESPAFVAAQGACLDKAPELDSVGVGG
jgi:hypothetical protein